MCCCCYRFSAFSMRAYICDRVYFPPLLPWLLSSPPLSSRPGATPPIYELYALTWHGFFIGLLAFFFGYCFMLARIPFWKMLLTWRWLFLALAIALYIHRLLQPQMKVPNTWLAVESCCWIFAVLAFGHRHLNRPGRALQYLSQAAYPIYIIHMIFLYLACWVVFPLAANDWLKFVLVLIFTITGCFALYELVIRRVGPLRVLFGLKATELHQEILIHGDPEGLKSLATLLIKLADTNQNDITNLPIEARHHVHLRPKYDLSNSSDNVIIGRLDAKGDRCFL